MAARESAIREIRAHFFFIGGALEIGIIHRVTTGAALGYVE
jgi:hypothetical protein